MPVWILRKQPLGWIERSWPLSAQWRQSEERQEGQYIVCQHRHKKAISLFKEQSIDVVGTWPCLQNQCVVCMYVCTSFSNYTAWKWQLEKKNHDLAPELAAYTLTRSFSYASHQCGHDSLTPNCHIYTRQVVVLFLQLSLSSCVVRKTCTSYTSLHNTYWQYVCMYACLMCKHITLGGRTGKVHACSSTTGLH